MKYVRLIGVVLLGAIMDSGAAHTVVHPKDIEAVRQGFIKALAQANAQNQTTNDMFMDSAYHDQAQYNRGVQEYNLTNNTNLQHAYIPTSSQNKTSPAQLAKNPDTYTVPVSGPNTPSFGDQPHQYTVTNTNGHNWLPNASGSNAICPAYNNRIIPSTTPYYSVENVSTCILVDKIQNKYGFDELDYSKHRPAPMIVLVGLKRTNGKYKCVIPESTESQWRTTSQAELKMQRWWAVNTAISKQHAESKKPIITRKTIDIM